MAPAGKPLLFITGFLGAGKTTLLREMILEFKARDIRADVILNDFANAEIDAATIDQTVATVAPIAASCACCESLDELVALCGAAATGEGDVLLIELNGTADPLAILESFTLIADKLPFFPRLQVSVVDARHWERRGEWSPLERRQVETAGFWLPTHTDAIEQSRLREVELGVGKIAPFATATTAKQLSELLGTELTTEESASPAIPQSTLPRLSRKNDDVHALSHRFTGCQVQLPSPIERDQMEQLMRNLPDWVYRAKALAELSGHPGQRWLFERSGNDPLPPPLSVNEIKRVPCSLVCIGPRLDADQLRKMVYEQLCAEARG